MKEVEQLGEYYKVYAKFMFGTMIEIENALPKEISKINVNFIKDIVGVPTLSLFHLIFITQNLFNMNVFCC
jgi:hypothetical protein